MSWNGRARGLAGTKRKAAPGFWVAWGVSSLGFNTSHCWLGVTAAVGGAKMADEGSGQGTDTKVELFQQK